MSFSIRAVVIASVIAVAVTGCAGAPEVSALGASKAPAQLLRNEVASRIPTEAVRELADSVDTSEECGGDGTQRFWRSSQLVFINKENADRVSTMFDDLLASLQDQGWTGNVSTPTPKVHAVFLDSKTTDAKIEIRATEADQFGKGGTFELAVTGPCVDTAGADSDDVKELEGRN